MVLFFGATHTMGEKLDVIGQSEANEIGKGINLSRPLTQKSTCCMNCLALRHRATDERMNY